jgi:hypothetical protein
MSDECLFAENINETYLERGGNFIHTANFYTDGHSQKILGKWFATHPGRREYIVAVSKSTCSAETRAVVPGSASIIAQVSSCLNRWKNAASDADNYSPLPRRPPPRNGRFSAPPRGYRPDPCVYIMGADGGMKCRESV